MSQDHLHISLHTKTNTKDLSHMLTTEYGKSNNTLVDLFFSDKGKCTTTFTALQDKLAQLFEEEDKLLSFIFHS
jgi:hypothetical protein